MGNAESYVKIRWIGLLKHYSKEDSDFFSICPIYAEPDDEEGLSLKIRRGD